MRPIKNLEEKLSKKKAKLQKYLEEKNKLEVKIKKLQTDVEYLQAKQFEQFKRAAKKENVEINVEDIPEILRLIKEFQQGLKTDLSGTTDTDDAEGLIATSPNGLRTLKSLKSITTVE